MDSIEKHIKEALKEARELPSSRELSLVITKLQEALMWLNNKE